MASINLDTFKKKQTNTKNYTYIDVHLDIMEEKKFIGQRNVVGRDMRVSYDIDAIKNSLVNLFNTIPGERLLLPDYGCDIRRYIFEPISDTNGKIIGDSIYNAIIKWESRVKVKNIYVQPIIDENQYNILLRIAVPFMTKLLDISSIFNKNGYILI